MASGKRRQIIIGIALLLLGVLLFIITAPIWTPWLLRPVLSRFDITFGDYERIGYSRLELRNVSYSNENAQFTASNVQIFQPSVWAWKHWSGRFTDEDVLVHGWRLTVTKRSNKETPSSQKSVSELLETANNAVIRAEPWLRTLHLQNGVVKIQDEEVAVPEAQWNNGKIEAEIVPRRFPDSIHLSGTLQSGNAGLRVRIPTLQTEAELQLSRTGETVAASGTISWITNKAELQASFGSDDLWPRTASLEASKVLIPASTIQLKGYNDVTGSLSAKWRSNTFAIEAEAFASPLDETNLPPVTATLRAAGTTNILQLQQLEFSTPWLHAQLSTNMIINFDGRMLSPEASFRLAVDLNKQTALAAKGDLTGEAFLQRSEEKIPRIRFNLNSHGFAGYGVRLDGISVQGDLNWPRLSVTSARVIFTDGAKALMNGEYDAIERQILRSELKLIGQIGHEFLPPELSYTNVALSATFSGSLTNPVHAGNIDVSGLRYNGFGPVQVSAQWTGKLYDVDSFSIRSVHGTTELAARGAANLTPRQIEIQLASADLQKSGESLLRLHKPTAIHLTKRPDWMMAVEDVEFTGIGDISVKGQVDWPRQGVIALAGTNLQANSFRDLIGTNVSRLHVNNISIQGSWSNSPVRFSAKASISYPWKKDKPVILNLKANGNGEGIDVGHLSLRTGKGDILSAKGHLPFVIMPGSRTNLLEVFEQGDLRLTARTHPQNGEIWEELSRFTRIQLERPELHLNVAGTLLNPEGSAHFQAASARWIEKTRTNIPPLKNLSSSVLFSRRRVHLRDFTAFAEGQKIQITAESPIDDNLTNNWNNVVDWRNASGRVLIQDADIAMFSKYLPDLLAPQGRLSVDVSFSPGPDLNGSVELRGAATRPLPNTGPLHDLNAKLRLVNQAIEFEEVRASLGGQPINFLGRIDFATKRPGKLPLIDVFLRGENIPLARRTDLILRSDLNLHLANVTNDVPLISGNVRLRDSFLLGDLRQLVPGRVASPKRRPPYFSIDQAPFSEWMLDVHVTGDDFLRARSPLFRGTISANVRLSGPLKEPVAIGDVEIRNGTVIFPFANFQVQQGWVTLTSDAPYRPQLLLNGRSRAFGYDLNMSLSGPVDRPIIEFTSTPPLSSEQIILMVTAGEVPRRGFGFSTQQRAQRLAVFVGKNLLSRFSDNAGAERLSITTGEEISEQGRETYSLEYRINDDWSIVGEYDRFGALNVGIKWRVYSR